LIVHWSEEMMLQVKNANLFKESISHKELLGGSRDVSVTMLDSHGGESSLLNLEGNSLGQIHINLSLLLWMDSWVHSSSEDVEALVSSFVDHLYLIQINY
jgi:hypothetical protein